MKESIAVRAALSETGGRVYTTIQWDDQHPFEVRFVFTTTSPSGGTQGIPWYISRALIAAALNKSGKVGEGDVVACRHGDVLRLRLWSTTMNKFTAFEFTAPVLAMFIARTEKSVPIGEENIPDSVFDKLLEDCVRDAQA